MKKYVFFVTFVALVAGNLSAQDIVNRFSPSSNYFSESWPDSSNMVFTGSMTTMGGDIAAKGFYTTDTLLIYGLASVFISPLHDNVQGRFDMGMYDTAALRQTELRLYRYDPQTIDTMIQEGESLAVREDETPVSYFYDPGVPKGIGQTDMCQPMPVYEQYFSTPQMMRGSFYGAYLQPVKKDGEAKIPLPLFSVGFGYSDGYTHELGQSVAVHRILSDEDGGHSFWSFSTVPYLWYTFPILTPDPDTTGTGGDTLAVTQADMVGRYVSVQPNPAVDEARVLSSFGLERIEAYNAEGRLVFKQEATGLEATLDVKGWPRGTYLLRIQTPMGVVTKKLLVQ